MSEFYLYQGLITLKQKAGVFVYLEGTKAEPNSLRAAFPSLIIRDKYNMGTDNLKEASKLHRDIYTVLSKQGFTTVYRRSIWNAPYDAVKETVEKMLGTKALYINFEKVLEILI